LFIHSLFVENQLHLRYYQWKKTLKTNSFPCGTFTPVKGKRNKKLKKGTDSDQYTDENKSDILGSLNNSMGIPREFHRKTESWAPHQGSESKCAV